MLARDHHEGGIFSSRLLRGRRAPDPAEDGELHRIIAELARRIGIHRHISPDAVFPGTITRTRGGGETLAREALTRETLTRFDPGVASLASPSCAYVCGASRVSEGGMVVADASAENN